jgi:hypothetical protein
VKLTLLLALISFALALIFYGWHVAHGVWTWQFWALWGLFLWCLSGAHDRVP